MKLRIKSKHLFAVFFSFLSLLWVIPIVMVFLISMKDNREYMMTKLWELPESIWSLFSNWEIAMERLHLAPALLNSFIYAAGGSAMGVFLASLAAYSLVKLKVKRRFFLFMVIFSGTVFPFQIYLIPLFKGYLVTDLYDSRFGMLLIYTTLMIPFCLLVFHRFFSTIPNEYIEAAKIDGASSFRIYAAIVLPMSKAPLIILFLTQFTWIWNDLLFSQLLTISVEIRPVMPTLATLNSMTVGIFGTPLVMTAVLIGSLPMLILFVLLQRYFMQGLVLTTAGE